MHGKLTKTILEDLEGIYFSELKIINDKKGTFYWIEC